MKRHTVPDDAITEAMAVAYLDRHPDLLLHHPELLVKMDVPHGGDGAVSLVERQLALLREQIAQERQRLAFLVERAREYESLSEHLHELTTKLILARSVKHVQDILDVELRIEFGAEAVALLPSPPPDEAPKHAPSQTPKDPQEIAPDTPAAAPTDIDKLLELDHCQCGPLNPDQYAELFGSQVENLRSAALIPLRAPKMHGLLAIASHDPDRFTPDMGTVALERLADIIGAKLIELALSHHD
ncbi:DUF484 family protein [Thiorhodovibrio frisius]|uniref:Phytochrome sensor protein n=1 Tax=Thiorhodovibrio frisius TaxID=631362 RepID=H8YXR1_9GAMM|nr:DUF484 family protein [Thiorhodovibrio frisius]EIC23237.1 hypothetical protein Thi970DRAFT_00893 [Thiorhodovibrio frisius]WPL23687.1 hypothetical protein Thiofri_03887 [Thiorhodovibrio frisius]